MAITQEEAIERARQDLIKLKAYFDKYKLCYWISMSGRRGFHLHFDIPLSISPSKKLDIMNKMLVTLPKKLKLATLDSNSYSLRKVIKTPYSIVTTDSKTLVCLPLSDVQITNFKISDVEVNNVLKTIKIKDRGLLARNEQQPKKEQQTNFKKMLKSWGVKV